MSTYSHRLQPALQNLLQLVVRLFHPRSLWLTHISADVCGRRKSLVKPVTWQNISSCSVLSPEIVMHDDAYIGGLSENNIKCVVHDDLRWKNWTTPYILPRHWLYEWFSQFRRCGTYSVLSRSPSTVLTQQLVFVALTLSAFAFQLFVLLFASMGLGLSIVGNDTRETVTAVVLVMPWAEYAWYISGWCGSRTINEFICCLLWWHFLSRLL